MLQILKTFGVHCIIPVGHFFLLIGLIFLPDQCNSVRILFSMSVQTVFCMHNDFRNLLICAMFDLWPCSQAAPQHIISSGGAWKWAWEGSKLIKHLFYNAHLTHLASPPETIWCLHLSCCTASLAWMAVSIADTYVPARTRIDQDTQYSSGREQSSSAEKGES